jgi:hypothetical protein
MLRCCHAALVSPYQPSLEMLMRTDLVAEDGLVADEDAVSVAAGGEDGALGARLKGADFVEEIFGEEEELFEGNVLAEGDEVHLVVVTVEGAVGVDEGGAVVGGVAGFVRGVGLEADVSHDDGGLRRSSQGRHGGAELWVYVLERRGGLGPDDEIGCDGGVSVGLVSSGIPSRNFVEGWRLR